MNNALKYIFPAMMAFILLSSAGCSDQNAITDQNTEISNNNWAYTNKLKFVVQVDNETISYNLLLNLRVTGDYKYSNLFFLIHQTGPDKKTTTTRYESKLADPDGQWLGQGSGNLYSFQMPFRVSYKFPAKGTYTFVIEQNMRDNPLREISDVGLRLEKAQ